MIIKSIIGTTCACITVVSFNTSAALIERLGGLAYYDDVADLTWLADANAAAGSAYDTWSPGSGGMNWADANDWAASLTIGGVGGWRLPDTIDVGNDGPTFSTFYQGVDYAYNITTHSELSNMFYNVLGNSASFDTSGNPQAGGLSNTGPFSNLQPAWYWSATEFASNTTWAWIFDMTSGFQGESHKDSHPVAWAVQSGDVGAVPVPAAAWLFGSGLLGLIGVARRKKA